MQTLKYIGVGIIGVVVGLLLTGAVGGQRVGGVFSLTEKSFDDVVVNDDITITDALDVNGETTAQGFTQGGGVGTLTDANGGTYTLTEAELLASNYLKFAAGGAGQAVIALTFPATSTMTTLIANAGDCREWVYDASALSAATTTTLTAGTGHDVIAYTTNDDVIDGAEFSLIRMCRQSDGDVTTFVSELLHAD